MNALLLAALLVPDATPKATVQAFVDAIKAHDVAAAARRVVGGKPVGVPLAAGMPTLRVALGEERIDGDSATVEVDAAIEFSGRAIRDAHEHETVSLRRADGDWRIVPAPKSAVDKPRVPGAERPLVARWALLVTDAELMSRAHKAAIRSQSLSNVKVIALATMMYAQDHDERFPTATGFRAAVTPYLARMNGPRRAGADVFNVPGAPRNLTYFLDPRLSGRSLTAIGPISQVAMIVLGKSNRAAFPYEGMTVLSYADGHVSAADPAKVYKARTIPLG